MRSLICLLLFVGLAIGAPARLTGRQQRIVNIWGKETDVTRAETILEEEAAKLGITAEEYFEGCSADYDSLTLTPEEEAIFKQDLARAQKDAANGDVLTFESKDDVLKGFEKRFPKSYAIWDKRFVVVKKHINKLPEDAQTFVRNIGNTLLDAFYSISKTATAQSFENPIKEIAKMGKTVKKLTSDYEALPQSSKDALEKTFCSRASIRISGKEEEMKKYIAMMNMMAEMDKLVQ